MDDSAAPGLNGGELTDAETRTDQKHKEREVEPTLISFGRARSSCRWRARFYCHPHFRISPRQNNSPPNQSVPENQIQPVGQNPVPLNGHGDDEGHKLPLVKV